MLPGCATLSIVTFGMSGISYIATGKSLSDHALSTMKEQDCALHRVIFDEIMCHENSDGIETNGKMILAKNMGQQENHQAMNSLSRVKIVETAITKPSSNIIKSASSIEESNVSSSFSRGKQLIKNQQKHYIEQWHNVAKYKVIGSFNNKFNAINLANLYPEGEAMVITNEKTSTEQLTKVYGAKYRVVLTPYFANAQPIEATEIAKTLKSPYWMLSLCTKTLSPPPCLNKKVILASTNIH